MQLSRNLKLLCTLVLSAGLTFSVACGEGAQDNQTTQQNQNDGSNDGTNDGSNDGSNDSNQNGDECSTETEGEDCADGQVCEDGQCVPECDCAEGETCNADGECVSDEGAPYVEPADPTPTCEDDSPPARCSEDAGSYEDFGPASYVDQLEIAESDECCFDYTDDGDVDNKLADITQYVPAEDLDGEGLEGVNNEIQTAIDEGEIAIVLEHAGLTEMSDGQEYDINFLFAQDVPGSEATIDPASFDEGTHPHAMVPNATVTDEDGTLVVEAGPGNVVLQLNLGALTGGQVDAELNLTISNATIKADMVGSSIDGGVELENGEIGGVIRFEDVFEGINEIATDCDCLGNPDQLADFNDEEGICQMSEEERSDLYDEDQYEDITEYCTDNGEEVCGSLGQFCPAFDLITNLNLADVDTSDDGEADAFTAGLTFSATATTIGGVGDGQTE